MSNLQNKKQNGMECKDGVCSLPPAKEKPHIECDGDTCRLVSAEETTTETPVVNLEDLL